MPNKDLILALDTSSDFLACAVGRLDANGKIVLLAAADQPARREANVKLLPAIDDLFTAVNLDKSSIQAVVCGLGPGSFTGVRIAVASAKGIARGLNVPLYGVSTLDAVAWGAWLAGTRGRLGVAADAMRGEIYPARFTLNNNGVERQDAHSVTKAALVATKWLGEKDLLLTGDGLHKYLDILPKFTVLSQQLWTPSGAGVLRALESNLASGRQGSGDPATLLPIYTRLADAEENERKRLASGGETAQGALVEVPVSGVAEVSSSPVFRPAAEVDLDAIAVIEEQLFAKEIITLSGECWTRAMFADDIKHTDRSWWVCYIDNQLAGFGGAQVLDGQLHIMDLAVAKPFRHQGIASLLMSKLATDGKALGATTITLEVRATNIAAQNLYKKLGLEQQGIRPRYYAPEQAGGSRCDAIIMTGNIDAFRLCEKDCHFGQNPLPPEGLSSESLPSGGPASKSLSSGGPASESLSSEGLSSGNLSSGSLSLVGLPFEDLPPKAPVPTSAPVILAIETSCDETAAAIIDGDSQLLSNVVASQVDFHARFGGVVPEIASRKHTEAIVGVVDEAMEQAQLTNPKTGHPNWQNLNAIAVTYAPGLIGALVVGMAFAKGLSWSTGLPLVRVNHLEGHIYANKFAQPSTLTPPFVIALLSGGNTMLVLVKTWGEYRVLGQTLDDAVGEAFDKVAKALGLGYPGGPVISRLALQGDPKAIEFPRALLHSGDLQFSLSGLKTAVITYIKRQQELGDQLNTANIAAAFEQAVIDVQVAKALTACQQSGVKTFCIGGGVAANTALRQAYVKAMEPKGIAVVFPPPLACTDNAAMIASVALERYRVSNFSPLSSDAQAHADLELPY